MYLFFFTEVFFFSFTDFSCNYSSSLITQNSLSFMTGIQYITNSNEEKSFKCSFCTYATPYIGNIQRHRRIHSGNIYQCTVCMKIFHYIQKLSYHLKLHTGEKPYECCRCFKRFRVPSEHMKKMH